MGKRGFTLVELTVVIAVLAILAGIAVPAMAGYRSRAAEGINEANCLTVERQIFAIRSVCEEEFEEVPKGTEIEALNEWFRFGTWEISAPGALEVRFENREVEAGTSMKVVLYEIGEEGLEEEDVDAYYVRHETEPTVPVHACRDWDGDCVCDIAGCMEVMHEEALFGGNGFCEKCGIHFRHADENGNQICDGCNLDFTTEQAHVCAWEDGECLCRCGANRCDHGSSGAGRCPFCGQNNYPRAPCPNCSHIN